MPTKIKPELLSPAGDIEKLETAVRFGADAIYVGAGEYSLRAGQTAFSIEDLKKGVLFAHANNAKVYLAMNIFAFDDDIVGMMDYLNEAVKAGIDAVIVSDPGILSLIGQEHKKLKIHLSTQANTLNTEAVRFWKKLGVKRIVLGREVSLKQVKSIRKKVPGIELELFVHGAMCMSYSGRCFMSKHMTGRSANRGECTHPCRWEYTLKEEQRPGEEFDVVEDKRGTYIMNSKDLCMIEHLPELIGAGVDSFKIEGRMKTPYYAALTTKIYRQAIDQYFKDPKDHKFDPTWLEELGKISHRNYTTGFYLGENDMENAGKGAYTRTHDFVGVVVGYNKANAELEVNGRNRFGVGDELEVLDPKNIAIRKLKIEKIRDDKGRSLSEAHNQYHVFVTSNTKGEVSPHSLLRRKI